MSFCCYSVSQTTAVALLGVVVSSWVIGVVSRRGKLDKSMLGESLLVVCVSVRSIVGYMEFQGNNIRSLWNLCCRELNDHVEVENEGNWIIWCQ